MSRIIVSRADLQADSYADTKQLPSTPDGYATRLLKYIPSEVIALYLTLTSLLKSSGDTGLPLEWIVFAFGVLVTPLYLWRIQRVHKPLQLVISTGAFAAWAFALGGPFASLGWYTPTYGGMFLSIYTFLIPVIEP